MGKERHRDPLLTVGQSHAAPPAGQYWNRMNCRAEDDESAAQRAKILALKGQDEMHCDVERQGTRADSLEDHTHTHTQKHTESHRNRIRIVFIAK